MSESKISSEPRKLRADAQRNREHILEIARQAFAAQGDSVTLEDIVRLSGRGVGTLYRHFPTRDALIEAVYLAEVEKLAAAGRDLAESVPPIEALRQWMLRFIDYMGTKSALRETLSGLVSGTDALYARSTELVSTTMEMLVERAVQSGDIRRDFEPLDLLRAVAGVANAGPGAEENARRFVDILIAGIRLSKP